MTEAHPLTPHQKATIERAVAEAERRTSAEIVVAIAERSSRYERADDLFGLTVAAVAVVLAWIVWSTSFTHVPSENPAAPAIGAGFGAAMLVAWAVAGAVLARLVPALARPFIGRRRLEEAVRRRGAEAFHQLHVRRTRGSSGVLIFVSLFERTVWIAGDDAVESRLAHGAGPDAVWAPVRDRVVAGFRDTPAHAEEALADAVRLAADVLAPHFPPAPTDENELADEVRVVR